MLRKQSSASEPIPAADIREAERLAALDALDVIDAPRNEAFDRIVSLIRDIFDVPIALVSVLDAHRQLYKACEGLAADEVERKNTFCSHAILSAAPTIIHDATLDERVSDNPHVTGEPHVRFYAGVPLRTSDGHNIGTVCAIDLKPRAFGARETRMLVNLAELVMEHIELQQLATVDALTGALSRRAFRTGGERAVSLAQRHKHNLSLIVLDIDHFKTINDAFGHAAGDRVLADVAAACSASLRDTDIFGRIGGEEFALLLPHTDRHGALEVAEKLRGVISAVPFEPDGTSRRVTASFGVATLDIVTKDMDCLLAHADAALYEAKAAGRNRVVGWRVSQPEARRRVLKAGTIHFNNRMSTVDCTVRTLSEEGAGLDLSSSYGLPDRFYLMIRSDGTDKPCRIVSQTERHIEIEFV